LSLAAFTGAWGARGEMPLAVALVGLGVLMVVLALSFATLTVRDDGDSLAIRFGPLPMFRKRIAYGVITSAEASRSALIDGWGIHYIPGRGWTYNLWGWTCVQLRVNGRTIRVGSDDAENLARFLGTKIRGAGMAGARNHA
jgi:hypothetical protein